MNVGKKLADGCNVVLGAKFKLYAECYAWSPLWL